MGEVIHIGAYLRRKHGEDMPELYAMTDDEVITYLLTPEENLNG